MAFLGADYLTDRRGKMRAKRIFLCAAIVLVVMLFISGCTLFEGSDTGGKCVA